MLINANQHRGSRRCILCGVADVQGKFPGGSIGVSISSAILCVTILFIT